MADSLPEPELTLDEAVFTLVQNLPAPVQKFVLGPDRDRIVYELSRKYNLHTDQAGLFQKAFIHMLLGASAPEEFVTDLRAAHIDETTIQGLSKDVNEQVFIPLRTAERAQGVQPTAPAAAPPLPAAPQWVEVTPPQPMPQQVATPQPIYAPPAVPPRPPAMPPPILPGQPAPAAYAPRSVVTPMPSYAPQMSMQQSAPTPLNPQTLPIGHTMAADMEAAKLRYEAETMLTMPPQPTQQWQPAPPPQPWNIPPQGMSYAPPPMPPQNYMPPGYWPAQPMQAYPVPQYAYQYAQAAPAPIPMQPAPPPLVAPAPPAPVQPTQPAQALDTIELIPIPQMPDTTSSAQPVASETSPAPLPESTDPRAQAHERFGLDPYREPLV